MRLTHWPPSPGMVDIEELQSITVLRKTQIGTTGLGTPTIQWQTAAIVYGSIVAVSGVLRTTAPGVISWGKVTFSCQFALAQDGGYIVRPRDILVDQNGVTYLVRFVTDEGGAHVQLTGDLEQGSMNLLQNIAEQG